MKAIRRNSLEAQWVFQGGNILEASHNNETMTGSQVESEVRNFHNWKLYSPENRAYKLVFANGTTIDFKTK